MFIHRIVPGSNTPPRAGLLWLLPGLVLAILLLSTCSQSLASATAIADEVHLVVSKDARYYQRVGNALRDFVRRDYPGKTIAFHSVDNLEELRPRDNALFVCIGTPASIRVATLFPAQPQLNLFITRQVRESLAADAGQSRKAFLFVDQPIDRQFALARALAPDADVFAAISGPAYADKQAQVEKAARAVGVTLRSMTLTVESNPLALLSRLLDGADVFIPVPDSALINRNVAKWALNLAFQYKIPVIGFSQAYTDAGAAASIFTSPDDISRQAIGWLEQYFSNPGFDGWRAYPPAYFTVSVNSSVVRSLGLEIPEQLHEQVTQLLRDTSP